MMSPGAIHRAYLFLVLLFFYLKLFMLVNLQGIKTTGHKVQLMLQYFNGYSPNGQFYEWSIEYTGVRPYLYF